MKALLKNIPLHSFVIAPALILFLFVHNYSAITFSSTLRSYFFAIVFSALIFMFAFFILKKDGHKAGVVATFMILCFSFYGFVYELCEKLFHRGWWPFFEIHRYLVVLIVISSSVLWFFLFRTRRTFQSLTFSLNVFVIAFFLMNIIRLSTAYFSYKAPENGSVEAERAVPASDTMPDIYYIILDSYASDSVLSALYKYPSNPLTSFLKEKDFTLIPSSRTNYISTDPSLASSLNYSYLDSMEKKGRSVIYGNKVCAYLKNEGYSIVHVRSGYSVTRENYEADHIIDLDNLSEFERTLLRYSVFRLDDLLGYVRYKTLKEQLKIMYEVFEIKGPKFVFLHIVSPHPPYVCDENGNFKSSPRVVNVWWEPKEDYLLQLKFINSEMIRYLSAMFEKSNRKPVVLVQSDHGPWIQADSFEKIYEARSQILNAYHIPFGWKKNLYPHVTPVNSFRIIFNGLFNDSLPLLKDVPLSEESVRGNMNANLLKE